MLLSVGLPAHVCPCLHLSVCLSLPVYLPACWPAYACVHASGSACTCLCIWLLCLSLHVCVCLPACLCAHSLAAIIDLHGSVPGGTMSDEEDMAWGEQARIAVEQEANLSQGRAGIPNIVPPSAAGSNHMRCLPEEVSGSLRRRPCDRTAFLGRSLQQHQNSRRRGLHGCKAVPSHHGCQVSMDDSQEIASMVCLNHASQRCGSSNSSSSVRRTDASKGFEGAEMHSREQQKDDCQLQGGSNQPDDRLQGSHSRSRRQWQISQQHSMHGTYSMHGSREQSSKSHSTHSSWAYSVHSSRQGSRPCCSSDSNMHSMQSVRHRCQESIYSSNCWGKRLVSEADCQHASQIPVHVSQQYAIRNQVCVHHCNGLPRTSKAATRANFARGSVHSRSRAGLSQASVMPAFGSSRLAQEGYVGRAGFAWHMLNANAVNQTYSKTVSARQGVHVHAARLTRAVPQLSKFGHC